MFLTKKIFDCHIKLELKNLIHALTYVFVIISDSQEAFSENFRSVLSVARICDSAAIFISRESGVPVDVLFAISRTETGRTIDGIFQSWPWTVNMEGRGKWFQSQKEAVDYVKRHKRRGAKSFDIGCFQINYRWHGESFTSISEMFDPIANARYAAKFLDSLHEEFGNWTDAAGAYHSRTPQYSRRYKRRFTDLLMNVQGSQPPHLPKVKLADPTEDAEQVEKSQLLTAKQIKLGSLNEYLGVSIAVRLGGIEQRALHHLDVPIVRIEP